MNQRIPTPSVETALSPVGPMFSHHLQDVGEVPLSGFVIDRSPTTGNEINRSKYSSQASESLHLSLDLARATRIVNSLPAELESRYLLRKPLVVELKRVSMDSFVASFPDSDSHMSGDGQDDAIKELLCWMVEEYEDIESSGSHESELVKLDVLREYLDRTDDASGIEQE